MTASNPAASALGWVAAENSTCGELGRAASHSGSQNSTLLVSSTSATAQLRGLRAKHGALRMIPDWRHWNAQWASAEVPTLIEDGLELFNLSQWTRWARQATGASIVLTPSFCVRAGDHAAVRSLLRATQAAADDAELVTFLPMDSAMLTSWHIEELITALSSTRKRRFAFLFAGKERPLASSDCLQGLRKILASFPGSWILGVDALVATDALAHGAGWVAVGASSARRWPRRPGDTGGGPVAADFKPGTFLRSLLEFRSPSIYADWYANDRSPYCAQCARSIDSFDATPAEKSRIIEHGLHAITDFANELLLIDAPQRATWLQAERVKALTRHTQLTSPVRKVQADPTLRFLSEMDDPWLRSTTPVGAWI